jgi:DNA polymerase-1
MAVLLIDTYSLFFRAFYGLPPMTTSHGQPTGALYGFSTLLLKLLREESPQGGAFALDLPTPSFRHALASDYKAGRPATPSPLRAQLDVLPELLGAFGFPCFAAPGFEADDVLASLAHEQSSAGNACLIASGDRDMLQLVDERVEVLFLGQRGKPAQRYAVTDVQARFGIAPSRLPSYVALVGDPSDNLPKVPGVGAATAQRLIAAYGDIPTLLQQLDAVTPSTLRDKLAPYAEQMRKTEQLARLRIDAPLGAGPRTLGFTREAAGRTRALFERLEFKSLIARLQPWL